MIDIGHILPKAIEVKKTIQLYSVILNEFFLQIVLLFLEFKYHILYKILVESAVPPACMSVIAVKSHDFPQEAKYFLA